MSDNVVYHGRWHEPYDCLELRQTGRHYTLFRQNRPGGPFEAVQPVFVRAAMFRDWLELVYKPNRLGDLLLEERENWPEEVAHTPHHNLHPDIHKYRQAQAEPSPPDTALVERLGQVFWQQVNGRHFIDQHPINYYAASEPEDALSADAIYDILNEKWIKVEDLPVVEDLKTQFPVAFATALSIAKKLDLRLGELRRIVHDELSAREFSEDEKVFISEIRKYSQEDDKVSSIISELSDLYQLLHTARHNAFHSETDRWSRNYTDENIVWKLLEHWGYIGKIDVIAEMFWDGQKDLDVLAKIAQKAGHFKLCSQN